jgi:hypothetical protein
VEIVRELSVCPSCAAERANMAPEEVYVPPAMDLQAAAAEMEANDTVATEAPATETPETEVPESVT